MLDWLRGLFGWTPSETLIAYVPQVEVDSSLGTRLIATLDRGRLVYEVVVGDKRADQQTYEYAPVLQTENADVAVRFFLGSTREAIVSASASGVTLKVGIVGTNLVGIGNLDNEATIPERGAIELDTIDHKRDAILRGLNEIVLQHLTPSSRVVRLHKRTRGHDRVVDNGEDAVADRACKSLRGNDDVDAHTAASAAAANLSVGDEPHYCVLPSVAH